MGIPMGIPNSRPCTAAELPLVLQRSGQTAVRQVVGREMPGFTPAGVARQVEKMYQVALGVPQAVILVIQWPGVDDLAGHILLMPQENPFTGERELMILDIYTHGAARGRGLGSRLLQDAFTYAGSIGCRSLVAQVALHNQASLRLFSRAGFGSERVVMGLRI